MVQLLSHINQKSHLPASFRWTLNYLIIVHMQQKPLNSIFCIWLWFKQKQAVLCPWPTPTPSLWSLQGLWTGSFQCPLNATEKNYEESENMKLLCLCDHSCSHPPLRLWLMMRLFWRKCWSEVTLLKNIVSENILFPGEHMLERCLGRLFSVWRKPRRRTLWCW